MLLTAPFLLFILAGLLLASAYALVVCSCLHTWKQLPTWVIPETWKPRTRISVLIPARNEEANILSCLQAIQNQTYPEALIEVIVIDDHSSDQTYSIASAFSLERKNWKTLRLSSFLKETNTSAFKKKALETGIAMATGELIITTDADCLMGKNWLTSMVSFYESNPYKIIAAPVIFHQEKSLFERFQSLDFAGMMGVTASGIHRRNMNMCNGANLAYTRESFFSVNGFSGTEHLASGDDILLMQKISARYPGQTGFLKSREAAVYTLAKPDIPSFLSQRIRWATKSTQYRDWHITLALMVVYLFSWFIALSLLLAPFHDGKVILAGLVALAIKSAVDFFFLRELSAFFHRNELMKSFFPAQILHILYIIVVGTLGNFVRQYEWKGRKTT